MIRSNLSLNIVAALMLVLAVGCSNAGSGEDGDGGYAEAKEGYVCLGPEEAERMADGLLELINLERVSAGQPLPPVSHSPILSDIASSYACRMIEGDFFGHRDPDTGRSPGQRAIAGKYRFFAVGENLAAGLETPAEVMRVWMESPSHRRIILDPTWEEAGVGVRAGGAHGVYWVLEFGDPID